MKAYRDNPAVRGFTLAELANVLVIMGILLALVIPSFSHYLRSSRLQGYSNALYADIHYAHSLAVSKRRTYRIEFYSHEYRIVEVSTGETVRSRKLPSGYSFSASADPTFYAWGLTDAVTIDIRTGNKVNTLNLAANGNVTRD